MLYTSYYSNVLNDFRRFHIYRIAGIHLIRELTKNVESYEQIETGKITDSLHQGEFHRVYNLPLRIGNNTIYFLSEGDPFQVDIYDSKMGLISSVDTADTYQTFDIRSEKEDTCYIKLFPSSDKRFGIFALHSASGPRYFPHFRKVLAGAGAAAVLSLIIYAVIYIKRKKYSRMSLKSFMD